MTGRDTYEAFRGALSYRLGVPASSLDPETRFSAIPAPVPGLARLVALSWMADEAGMEVPVDLCDSVDTLGELHDWFTVLIGNGDDRNRGVEA